MSITECGMACHQSHAGRIFWLALMPTRPAYLKNHRLFSDRFALDHFACSLRISSYAQRMLKNVLLLFCVSVAVAAESPRKPNVLVIISDDAGYAEFSMHGSKTMETPYIDSIAKNGMQFTQGYVSGSVCSPTRAGLLAGRYQQRFGHEFNVPPSMSETNGLPLTETLLPAVMKSAGYRTIALGKWHLGYAPKFHPMERGFTDYYGFLQGSRSYFPQEKPSKLNGLMRDREYIKEEFTYMTDHLAEETAKYITKHKAEPFFIYLAFNATHGPNHTTEDDLKKAGGNKIKAMTIALDRAVGLVLDSLKKNEIDDDTLVFFLNDNGGAAGHNNAPLRGMKGQTWEGGIRVPFAVQWPGKIPAGQKSDSPVIALDIFPTAMAAAGIEKSPGKPLDGANLLPLMTGKSKELPHKTLYWKMGNTWAVRDGNLKLVAVNGQPGGATAQLFDLAQDPSETTDLSSKQPEDAKRLRALYDAWVTTHQPTPWGQAKAGPKAGKKRKKKAAQ